MPHAATTILADAEPDRIDADKWRPMIMSFRNLTASRQGKWHTSELAKILEAAYRA